MQKLDPQTDMTHTVLGVAAPPPGTGFSSEIDASDSQWTLIVVYGVGVGSMTVTIQDTDVSGSGHADTAISVAKSGTNPTAKLLLHREAARRFIRTKTVQASLAGVIVSAVRLTQANGFTPAFDTIATK